VLDYAINSIKKPIEFLPTGISVDSATDSLTDTAWLPHNTMTALTIRSVDDN
jgi:hypothetical protein